MASNDKKYGRTLFDLIAEHHKLTFFIFLLLLLGTIILIFSKVPVKIGNVEVGTKPEVTHDTIIKKQTDTQYLTKIPIISKPNEKSQKKTKDGIRENNDKIISNWLVSNNWVFDISNDFKVVKYSMIANFKVNGTLDLESYHSHEHSYYDWQIKSGILTFNSRRDGDHFVDVRYSSNSITETNPMYISGKGEGFGYKKWILIKEN